MPTIIVLTEEALRAGDVTNILNLHTEEDTRFEILVPAAERNVVTDFIDHLSLFELREAWASLTHRESPDEAKQDAESALAASVDLFAAAGAAAAGVVVADDPLPAVQQAVSNLNASELIVVTRPHAVHDTFHQDWASRARDDLGLPVLHFYSGTDFVG